MAMPLPDIPELELRRRDLYYLLPGGLIALSGLGLFHLLTLPEHVRGFFVYYPFLVLVAGIFFGWRFNHTRLIFALLVLAVAEQTLTLSKIDPARTVAIAAAEGLIPLNLAMIGFCLSYIGGLSVIVTWLDRSTLTPLARTGVIFLAMFVLFPLATLVGLAGSLIDLKNGPKRRHDPLAGFGKQDSRPR